MKSSDGAADPVAAGRGCDDASSIALMPSALRTVGY